MRRFLIICGVVAMTSLKAIALPSLGDAQGDFNNGKYRQSLEKISSILTDPREKVNAETRYSLLMLRGDCMLQMRRQDLAIDAFNAAGLVAKGDTNLDKQAIAMASAILTQASTNLKYVPSNDGDKIAYDILTDTGRRDAAKAMFDDKYRQIAPIIETSLSGNSLAVLESMVPSMVDMFWLELAGTGKTDKTLPLGKSVGARARELISPALDRNATRVGELAQLAKEPVEAPAGSKDAFTYRGLKPMERDELRDLEAALTKIHILSQKAKQMGFRMGGTPEAWNEIIANCAEARQKARSIGMSPAKASANAAEE